MFTMKFSTANAAFDDKEAEVSRILRDIAECVERGLTNGRVADYNGNVVGKWELK